MKNEMPMVWLCITLLAITTIILGLSGCVSTPDGTSRLVFSAAEIQIILEEAEIAVEQYLAVVVPDPTPAQQLAISAGRIVVRIAISRLREAELYDVAARLEIKAELESEPELEPLVE